MWLADRSYRRSQDAVVFIFVRDAIAIVVIVEVIADARSGDRLLADSAVMTRASYRSG